MKDAISSFLRVYEFAESRKWSREEKVGQAVELLSRTPAGRLRSVSHVRDVIIPAIRHGQIEFLFNEDKKPVGYVIWAYLAEDVEQKIFKAPYTLHYSEWNEGESLWLIDVVTQNGYLKDVIKHLRDKLFLEAKSIRFCISRRNKHRALEIERGQFTGCLRSMPPDPVTCRCGNPSSECNQWNSFKNNGSLRAHLNPSYTHAS